jgi:hypothetical protein
MENPELHENIRKGVDLSVKALKKVYPFILGWELSDTWYKYNTTLYIELLMDVEKLSEIFTWELSQYVTSKLERGEEVKSPATLAPFEWGEYGSEEFETKSEISHKLGRDIRKALNQAYDFLPDGYKQTWETSFGKSQTELAVDYYIFKS